MAVVTILYRRSALKRYFVSAPLKSPATKIRGLVPMLVVLVAVRMAW